MLIFIRPAQRKTFDVNNLVGMKILPRLRFGFNHLRDHKFRHGFRHILHPLYPCSIEAETTAYYFRRSHFFNANRPALINDFNETDNTFSARNNIKLIDLILYDNDKFDNKKNRKILICTKKLIEDSQRFDEHLL